MIQDEERLREMVRAGVHIGHRKSRRHPRMMPYIYGIRGNTEIIDVTKTALALETAADFLKGRSAQGATILWCGTRPSHAVLVKETAERLRIPYVIERWIGGTITNFAVVGKRLESFRQLAQREVSGELSEKYTKAEHLRFQRQLARLERELGGIKELTRPPDVVILSSLRSDQIAAREARSRKIPVIAIVDTDADPALADLAIPANDDAISAVRMVSERLATAIAEGKTQWQEAQHKKQAADAAERKAKSSPSA